ncbi:MAG: CDP-diacylglycerol/serineO-phosphatidyltransfera se [Bacteroidetes bacterium]|nr:CDP-diacylglycerol/serineO-phosphatidyltransfera se [Bacteroidota bacterium]
MSFIKRNIPNTITCGNLLCGCLAIVKAFEGDLVWAAYLVGLAAVLDFFDGFAARLLKVSSPIGKDLDSLADMVTFGVVPGVIMYKIAQFGQQAYVEEATIGLKLESVSWSEIVPLFCFVITIFSGIRLAKFNNDARQTDSFIGVPTPAIAIFVCSIVLVFGAGKPPRDLGLGTLYAFLSNYHASHIPNDTKPVSMVSIDALSSFETMKLNFARVYVNTVNCVGISILFSFLLVSELPLIALKFKHFKWKGNEIRFIFIIGAVILLASLQLVGIPLAIIFYILLSIINNILTKQKAKLPK